MWNCTYLTICKVKHSYSCFALIPQSYNAGSVYWPNRECFDVINVLINVNCIIWGGGRFVISVKLIYNMILKPLLLLIDTFIRHQVSRLASSQMVRNAKYWIKYKYCEYTQSFWFTYSYYACEMFKCGNCNDK